MNMRLLLLLVPALAATAFSQAAKNIVLFIGDAGGLPVLNAAAAYKGRPLSLFIQQMPHIALSETSSASAWVTDSAAGMTAIVTGRKTHNGVLSESDAAERSTKDGEILTTILEYAEAHGLSTGIVTNDVVTGATAASCYAHSNERKKSGAIFAQLLKPRRGDGIDLLIGRAGNVKADASLAAGTDIVAALHDRGYAVCSTLGELQSRGGRAIVLLPEADIDVSRAVRLARANLARNPKGYFLMVESDLHTTELKRGLDRALVLDRIVEETVKSAGDATLIIFTADHSFDTRLKGGKKGDLLSVSDASSDAANSPIRVDRGHTGEEVLIAAHGPGAERVHGFLSNTEIFQIMMRAYGWAAE